MSSLIICGVHQWTDICRSMDTVRESWRASEIKKHGDSAAMARSGADVDVFSAKEAVYSSIQWHSKKSCYHDTLSLQQ